MEIENYNNYLIYEDGRVYSKNKKDFMKYDINNKGYYCIKLCKNSKYKKFYIHRLVALHYIPNPDNKEEVDHIDRNPKNNHKENLRWTTHYENMLNRNISQKNIHYAKKDKLFVFQKKIKNQRFSKSFKTLEEAEKYRDDFYNDNKEILSM